MGKKKKPAPEPVPEPTPEPVDTEPQVRSTSYSSSGGDPNDYNSIMQGYRNFSETGGFSPDDLANIRARAVSPIRAVYANAQRDVNRQKALQGGYSPNFTASMAKMAREQSMSQADAAVGREAGIAEQVREGKLAGLGGMLNTLGQAPSSGGGTSYYEKDKPEEEEAPVAEKKKSGFWGKFGGALKKVGQVALPIVSSFIPGGSLVEKGLNRSGALGKIAKSALGTKQIPGLASVPNVRPARR
jgi:hypothetical protein